MTTHKQRRRKLRYLSMHSADLNTALKATCKQKKGRSARGSREKRMGFAGRESFLDYIEYINIARASTTVQQAPENNLCITITLEDIALIDQIVELLTLGGWDPKHHPVIVAKCLVNNYGFELSRLTTNDYNQLVEEELQWYLMGIISHPKLVEESHRMFNNIGLVRAITETMVDGWDRLYSL